ncbi:LysR family transcriptional regulator [Pseudomonas sp. MAFF212428]|uniref:LysR family transcriptional regulator n=1 Tax=Pseudomonas brassicae TaxID=2708063 RepID=A0A6B3NN67_9PSED|nr:LysR family transcriptional regulator [Pseudomonas brassicae]NER59877.1 LysR family transcriptional regulator [Pseudomonas brassicae]NER63276.1 LysR family transcriptional regulator [Pseudomonas brassicae]
MPPDITHASFCNGIRYKHLVLIDTLARTRNMHAAATLMNLTQPALSKMLRDVEDQFGFPFFERLPRSMPPTELGDYVVRFAQNALADSQQFVSQVNRLRSGGHGHLRVGGIFASTAQVLPQAIAAIKARYPLLSIEVIEQSSDHLLIMLEQHKLDIMIGRFTDERFRALFDFHPLEPETFSLVVNKSHPLNDDTSITPAALSDWPWVLYPVGTPIRDRLEQAFNLAGIPIPSDSVETTSMPVFLQLLQSAPMIAVLPRTMIVESLSNGLVKELPCPLALSPLEYGVLTRKDKPLSGAARLFVDMLVEGARRRRGEQGERDD